MQRYSVDRIEGDYAVLMDDDCSTVLVLLTDLPKGTKEGSVLLAVAGEYKLDAAEEQLRRNEILSLQEKFRRKK